jgi:dTMP kinase
MNRGILIAVEGIDGAGKTTQVKLLADFFARVGEPAITSKEPTDGTWGQKIRKSASNGRMSLQDELQAFTEDRKEHLRDKILPALERGDTVILDRYFYSTIAYQGSRGGNIDVIAAMMMHTAPDPDIVLLIDVPAEIGLARIREGREESPNAFESQKNLRAVRTTFLDVAAKHQNVSVINGTPSIPIVQEAIQKTLLQGILYKRHCAKHWGCDDVFNCVYRKTDTCRWAKMMQLAAKSG